MDLSLTGSQIGSSRSRGSLSNRSTKSSVPSARTRHNKLVNADGNARKPPGGQKTPNPNFMSMIDSGAKRKTRPTSSTLGDRREVKYRSAGDLASPLRATPMGGSNTNIAATDSARTDSTVQPEPVRTGTDHLIDTVLCLPNSSQSLDNWLESSMAVADSKDWQEIPLTDSQDLVSISQRGAAAPPLTRPSTEAQLKLQLNNSSSMGFSAVGSGRPPCKVSSIENLRHKEPVNLTRPQGTSGPAAGHLFGGSSAADPPGLNGHEAALPGQPVRSQQERRDEVEVLIFRMNRAARVIQRWWRKTHSRRASTKAAEAAMRRMMAQKHSSLVQQQQKEQQRQRPSSVAQDRGKADRQRAISELHRRREEKAKQQADVANAEVERLKAEGKIGAGSGLRSPGPGRPSPRSGRGAARAKKTDSSGAEGGGGGGRRGERKSPAGARADGLTETHGSAAPLASLLSELRDDGSSACGSIVDVLSNSARSERTTIDDICAALKQLEESESIKGKRNSDAGCEVNADHPRTKSAWVEDIDRLLNAETNSSPVTAASVTAILTSTLLKEHDERMEQLNVRPLPPDNLEQVSSDTKAVVDEVASQVELQRRALDDKAHEIVVLERALHQQEEKAVTSVSAVRAELARQMAAKQEEYHADLRRKEDLIDQLLDEKRKLQTLYKECVTEARAYKENKEKVLDQLGDRHKVEMQKLREKLAAAEKLRMEKWEERKIKEIRENTVKGVASELQTLMDQQKRARAEMAEQHKRELAGLRADYEAKLVSADERAERRYFEKVQELRDELTREKETACDREREMAKQRYESQLEIEMQALEAKRRQLYAEVKEEQERQATAASKQRAELDRDRLELDQRRALNAESMAKDFDAARAEAERRHANELREMKERLEAEKEAWLETQMKRQQAWSMARERELKDNLKKDRDRELERVIEELEKDRTSYREEVERTAENKIRRLREKYETENAEYERSERIALEKYNKIKAELLEVQGENEKLKVVLRQKEEETQEIKKHYEKLNRERAKVSDVVREEFAEQLLLTGEENKQLKMEMAELRARHRVEMDKKREENRRLEEEKERSLIEIHEKVKEAIRKKEENLQQLRVQYEAAEKRASKYEQLLAEQREKLVALKK